MIFWVKVKPKWGVQKACGVPECYTSLVWAMFTFTRVGYWNNVPVRMLHGQFRILYGHSLRKEAERCWSLYVIYQGVTCPCNFRQGNFVKEMPDKNTQIRFKEGRIILINIITDRSAFATRMHDLRWLYFVNPVLVIGNCPSWLQSDWI